MGKILCIALAFYSLPLFAEKGLTFEDQPDGGVVIKVPKEIVEQCQQEGGCVLISYKIIEQFVINSANHMCGKEI